ncbi:MAG: bifunctional DNA-formamidopyrimidine glycosylase/DNA-(apurinic or apyrimidinic site) lyase [Alphaproteobacteria bacterium]|nr:bifunctional DNA-formamidopyrimidine glycosylase/DNA-(apurinic or apyrimidinic site) lyase [Alphaproteobacteria bacterium]
MPELPEVETVRLGLEQAMRGKRCRQVQVFRSDLRFPVPADFCDLVQGKVFSEFRRRGKYILGFLDDSHLIVLHLGMSGRVRIYSPGQSCAIGTHDHVLLETEDGTAVVYHDPRRFGSLACSDVSGWESQAPFSAMGPEPLSDFDLCGHLVSVFKNKKTDIKAALLDQRVVAGLGNIYVCEALYDSGILPTRKACSLSYEEIDLLVSSIRKILLKAIKAGGSTLRDYKKTDGSLGYFQYQFAVYDKEGESCPDCNCAEGAVKRVVQGGRSTFYCPVKQV